MIQITASVRSDPSSYYGPTVTARESGRCREAHAILAEQKLSLLQGTLERVLWPCAHDTAHVLRREGE